jgi:hypothetical protein
MSSLLSDLHFELCWFLLGFACAAVVCRAAIGRWWP